MRTLFLILLLCSTSIAQDKEPPALTAARKEYETGINLAKRAHESTLEKLAKTYREKLAEIVEERTKKGDLDGALAVRKEGERVGKKEAKTRMFRDGNILVVGSNEKNRTYKIIGDRISFIASTGNEVVGQFIYNDGIASVDFGSAVNEVWCATNDGGVCVKCYTRAEPHKLHSFGIGTYVAK